MQLTAENYYSIEANNAYMSASFVKSMLNCESMAIAELRGEYERPTLDTTKPIVTAATITPNPVDAGATMIISVTITEG